MLDLEKVSLRYGGVRAVNDVSLHFRPGERVALIGPNGAGKSSLLSIMGGQSRASTGSIRLGSRDVTRLNPQRRADLGIARSFQITNLMSGLTVHQQAALSCLEQGPRGWVRRGQGTVADERASRLLDDWGIPRDVWHLSPKELSYGQQRSLELAMAMSRSPRVLLLDEPNVGLTPAENAALVQRIAELDPGIMVVLVAHDMDMVFGFAERVVVMQRGAVVVDGAPDEVRRDPLVREIYFGSADEEKAS